MTTSRWTRPVALGALVLALAGPAPMRGQSLRMVPDDHWAYTVADELLLRHPQLGSGLWLGRRPWREDDFHVLLERARAEGLAAQDAAARERLELLEGVFGRDTAGPATPEIDSEVWLEYDGYGSPDDASFDPAFLPPRFDGDENAIPEHRAYARHDFALQYGKHLALGWRYALDSHITSDPTRFREIGDRPGSVGGFAVLDANATVRFGALFVTVGRSELSLGNGRASSPFLSDSIPPVDQLRIEFGAKTVVFTGVIARLSTDEPNRSFVGGETVPGSEPTVVEASGLVDRILYVHRVDWQAHPAVQVAVSEGALVTGFGRGLEARYANLLIPFYLTENDSDEPGGGNVDINVFAEAEGSLSLPAGFRAYTTLVADEFFIDKAKRDTIGNSLAWRVGGMWGDPLGLPGVTVGAEYTRVDVFTYLHRGLNTNWTTYGVPLGSSLGPDADQLQGWLSWYPRPTARLTVDALARRGGERSVETTESNVDAGKQDFPSGTVQRELRLGVEGWMMLPLWGVEALGRVSARDVNNIANEPGRNDRLWQFNVGLRYRWRYP